MADKRVRITHRPSGDVIAEGPKGWGITPFEGNWYISDRYLETDGFRLTAIPGLCPYKFIYLWMNYESPRGEETRFLGWKYVVPNPVFPFIWYRVAVPGHHADLEVEVWEEEERDVVPAGRERG